MTRMQYLFKKIETRRSCATQSLYNIDFTCTKLNRAMLIRMVDAREQEQEHEHLYRSKYVVCERGTYCIFISLKNILTNLFEKIIPKVN